MPQPSDRGRGAPRRMAAATLALSAFVGAGAMAQPTPAAPASLPDDDAPDAVLDRAFEQQAHGDAERAAHTLQTLAERGHVVAMERLALMHWYGDTLYPRGRWSRETAAHWFARAADAGSEIGRHMHRVAAASAAKLAAQRR